MHFENFAANPTRFLKYVFEYFGMLYIKRLRTIWKQWAKVEKKVYYKLLREISENPQGNICGRVLLVKFLAKWDQPRKFCESLNSFSLEQIRKITFKHFNLTGNN